MMERMDDSGHDHDHIDNRRHGERRLSDQRMSVIAESPLLKILMYIVCSVGMPLIGWGLNALVTEVKAIHESLNQYNTTLQLHELRLTTVEKAMADGKRDRDNQIKQHDNELIDHEIRIKNLETKR